MYFWEDMLESQGLVYMQSECFESWKLLDRKDIVAYTSSIFGHALLKNSSESLLRFNDTVIIFIRQEATATIYDPKVIHIVASLRLINIKVKGHIADEVYRKDIRLCSSWISSEDCFITVAYSSHFVGAPLLAK